MIFAQSYNCFMKSQKIPMSVDEYYLLPQKRGWKYEYYGDAAVISPRQWTEAVELAITPQPFTMPYMVQTPSEDICAAIADGVRVAYQDSIEFCDYRPSYFGEAVQTMTSKFLKYGKQKHAWVITFPYQRSVRALAGCYVKPKKDESVVMLESLFVRPEWQRAGLASALLRYVLNQLASEGKTTLQSGYWLGNEASTAWHAAMGFKLLPDLTVTRIKLHDVRQELHRRELFGLDVAELQAQLEALKAEVERLERVADEQGYEAVAPTFRE
jgi:GNAT superfamily N-acetyltransferase